MIEELAKGIERLMPSRNIKSIFIFFKEVALKHGCANHAIEGKPPSTGVT